MEKTMKKLIQTMAAQLHNNWAEEQRATGLTKRIKVLLENGKWINKGDEGDNIVQKEQDILNTPYEKLDPHWQAENLAAAEVAVVLASKLPENPSDEDINGAAAEVHEKWIERNDWVKNPEYGDPKLAADYKNLPVEEQAKDIAQIKIALEILAG
jgi:hypothetical protein